MANYREKKWFVVRLSDGVTLSAAPGQVEAERFAAFLNEDKPCAVVSRKPGKIPQEQTFEQKVKQRKKDNDQRAANRRKIG